MNFDVTVRKNGERKNVKFISVNLNYINNYLIPTHEIIKIEETSMPDDAVLAEWKNFPKSVTNG